MHHTRRYRHGDTGPIESLMPPKNKNGEGSISKAGYRIFSINGQRIKEHRLVMENHIGRKLLPEENIHHKNGDRSDNRIENLEIWNTKQPAGQRVQDKVIYAKQILNLYGDQMTQDKLDKQEFLMKKLESILTFENIITKIKAYLELTTRQKQQHLKTLNKTEIKCLKNTIDKLPQLELLLDILIATHQQELNELHKLEEETSFNLIP